MRTALFKLCDGSHHLLFLEGPSLDVQTVGPLARTNSALNVPANARERIGGGTAGVGASQSALPRDSDSPAATIISRNNTAIATGRRGRPSSPRRGLSVRGPSPDDAAPETSPNSSALTLSMFRF